MSKVAIIMSVYKGDNLNHIIESLNSLVLQSYKKIDIFIAIDGPVSNEILSIVNDFKNENDNFYVYLRPFNRGLAHQLNFLISKALILNSYSYIARMDADDICHPDRIKEQVNFFFENPDVSVVGSDVEEIDNFNKVLFYKKMESSHEILKKNIIKRCPFNHPSVMFNMHNVNVQDLSYKEVSNTQDYYLWVDLIYKGYLFSNINKPLLKFRISDDFYHRRGFKKALNDFRARKYAMKKLNIKNFKSVSHNYMLFLLRLSPVFIKKFAYKKLR